MNRQLDPIVQQMVTQFAQTRIQLPDPIPSLTEFAQLFRGGEPTMPPPTVQPFDGTITDLMVPVRWGSVPARLYRPTTAHDQSAAIVFFHGGGFIAGNLNSHDGLCRELAASSAALLLSVEYRLAPEAPFPAGIEDAYDATQWLIQTAPELNVNPKQVAVAGDSAGGNLATAVALLALQKKAPLPAFQLLFYPKLDFINEYPSHIENRDIGIPQAISQLFDACYLPNHSQRSDPLASPVFATDLVGMPPGLIITADADTLRDEAEAYGHALSVAGSAVAIMRAMGQIHGFATMIDQIPSARLITQSAAALLGSTLRRIV